MRSSAIAPESGGFGGRGFEEGHNKREMSAYLFFDEGECKERKFEVEEEEEDGEKEWREEDFIERVRRRNEKRW
jgi:hypothetical protein